MIMLSIARTLELTALARIAAELSAFSSFLLAFPRALFEPLRCVNQVERSLAVFGTTYVDLVLLHYPRCFPGVCTSAEIARTEKDGGWREAWRALGTLAATGVVRARGVSNFNLDEVFSLQSVQGFALDAYLFSCQKVCTLLCWSICGNGLFRKGKNEVMLRLCLPTTIEQSNSR